MKNILPKRNRGQAVITSVLFFVFVSALVVSGLSTPIARRIQATRDFFHSRESYFVAEGSNEDVDYRLIAGKQYGTSESIVLNGVGATTTIASVPAGYETTSIGSSNTRIRKSQADLDQTNGVTISYGAQAGNGGIIFENNSWVNGNVYSNGPIVANGNNKIVGDTVSAGSSGSIQNLWIQNGSAYSHTLYNTWVDHDAYYWTSSWTTVLGTRHSGSTDMATATLPISDSFVSDLETDAATGGTQTCSGSSYTISGSTTIGPRVINCDLKITGGTITFAGNVWVNGSITISGSTNFVLSSALGTKSVALVADKTSNHTSSSQITLQNDVGYSDTATSSHLMFISQNSSAEQGGSTDAIQTQNTVTADLLLYALHGEIQLTNNSNIKEIAGYRIHLYNNAEIDFSSGYSSIFFSGHKGRYRFHFWHEIR